MSELFVGPFSVTRPDPTKPINWLSKRNPTHRRSKNIDPIEPDTTVTAELSAVNVNHIWTHNQYVNFTTTAEQLNWSAIVCCVVIKKYSNLLLSHTINKPTNQSINQSINQSNIRLKSTNASKTAKSLLNPTHLTDRSTQPMDNSELCDRSFCHSVCLSVCLWAG